MGSYLPQAQAAMKGLWVYRDFSSSYAPLFPYALAAALKWIWASPKMIVLLAVAADGVSLTLWLSMTAHLLPSAEWRRAALLYVASALPLANVVLDGQNQVWVAAFLAAAALLYGRGREHLAAVVLSIPLVLVKFLSLLTVPVFLFWNKQRLWFAATFAVLPIVVYGTLLAKGVDILVPLRIEGAYHLTSGCLPFLAAGILGSFGVAVPPRVFDGITASALAALCLWLVRQKTRAPAAAMLWALVMITMTLLLFSKKAYTTYLMLTFYPICALAASGVATRWRSMFFGLFGAVAMIEPTLWYRWLGSRQLSEIALHSAGGQRILSVAVFIVADIILLACYCWLWSVARTRLRPERAERLRVQTPTYSFLLRSSK
jgi:hypothetical protein